MPKGRFSVIPEHEFAHLYKTLGPNKMARKLGMTIQGIHGRRKRIESNLGAQLIAPDGTDRKRQIPTPQRKHYDCLNGVVIVGSDAHIWPGPLTTAQRAFLKFIADMKPRVVIANGDVMDFGAISRHDPLQWENTPSVIDELEAAKAFMQAVEDAAPSNCKFAWPAGNHDARFQARLAKVAPEYSGVHGTRLKDHFSPKWEPCYSAFINDDVVVKHRLKGGTGALRNNVLATRKHTITGHLHAQHVWPISSYSGTLYGVDAGMLADPDSEAFSYVEDNPLDWRSGFVVLTFHKGALLPPELVTTWDKRHVTFRGQIIPV